MTPVSKLFLWGFVLWLGTPVRGKSRGLWNCNQTASVFFYSSKWKTPMLQNMETNDVSRDRFGFVMRKFLKFAKGRTIDCRLHKNNVLLDCCENDNLAKFKPVEGKELATVGKTKWGHKISLVNIVLFFLNMFLAFVVICCGIIMSLQFSEPVIPAGLRQRIAMS